MSRWLGHSDSFRSSLESVADFDVLNSNCSTCTLLHTKYNCQTEPVVMTMAKRLGKRIYLLQAYKREGLIYHRGCVIVLQSATVFHEAGEPSSGYTFTISNMLQAHPQQRILCYYLLGLRTMHLYSNIVNTSSIALTFINLFLRCSFYHFSNSAQAQNQPLDLVI